MKRAIGIALYAAAGLAAALLLCAVAALIVVQTAWFGEKVRLRMVEEIEDATGGRVELGSFSFDWRTMTATARNLTIHGTEGPAEAPLFHADLVRVGLRIVSILEKRVDLESVLVDRPQVNLIVDAGGRTNLPQPKAARQARRGAIETVLDLAVKRFDLAHGTIHAQLRTLPLDVRGENLRAAILYRSAPARYDGEISFRDLDLKAGARPVLPVEVDARLALLADRLEIHQVRLAAGRSSLLANGTLDHFASPRLSLNYSGRIDVQDVTAGVDLGPLAHRGTITLDGRGTLSGAAGYSMTGKLRAGGLAVRQGGILIEDVRLDSAFSAAPGRVAFSGFTLSALGGRLDGRAEIAGFRTFAVDGVARDFSLQDMTLIHEVRRVAWDGAASGPVTVRGEVRNGRLAQLLVNTRLDLAPTPGPNPVQGTVDLSFDQAAGQIAFGPSSVATQFSRLSFNGVLGHRLNVTAETTDLKDLDPAIAMFSAGPAPSLPVTLVNGTARFEGDVAGPLANPTVEGHVAAANFVASGRRIDRFEADVTASAAGLSLSNAKLSRLGLRLTGDGRVAFEDWKASGAGTISGEFTLHAPHLADVVAAAGVTPPFEAATGDLTARIVAGGTLAAPVVSGRLQAVNVVAGGQPVDRVEGDARYAATRIDLDNVLLAYAGDKARLSASYDHPAGDWRQGRVQFTVSSGGIGLSHVKAAVDRVPGIEGRIETQIAGQLIVVPTGLRPGRMDGWASVQGIGVSGDRFGSVTLKAATQGQVVEARLDGALAGSTLTGASTWGLQGDYPVHGRIDFTSLQFSTLLARLRGTAGGEAPPFNGFAAGSIDFSGAVSDPRGWKASVNVPTVEIQPTVKVATTGKLSDLYLRNVGPVRLDVDPKGARVQQAHFQAKDTDLNVAGRIGFGVKNPWDLHVTGGVNLALLQDFVNRMYSSGSVALDVAVRGELATPDIYGKVQLKNASVNFIDFPNGIDNANGTILLYRDRATIDTFTAESGGGKIGVTGFASLAGQTTFHLRVNASGVRVRYPEGISSTVNASLSFTGTKDRSLAAGDVTVTRVGLNLESDLGAMLARSAMPIQTPLDPSPFLQGLRLSAHIVTAPQVRFETQLTKDLEGSADLRLRGDATRPLLLGRVLINQGHVNFFGTQYAINSGQILFVNATKIEPTVNLSLETRVRGVDVTLHISGPAEKMNMSYTSDPPLPFGDVLALLTTGREPGQASNATPTASAMVGQGYQPTGGASALLSEAISSPLTGRLQRFFGVSRLKINPLVTGLTTSNAAAQITVEQNITSNLTFTYITDLSRAQAQTIQMEWDFTGNWSGVAVREENGLFGIDFLYKKQIK